VQVSSGKELMRYSSCFTLGSLGNGALAAHDLLPCAFQGEDLAIEVWMRWLPLYKIGTWSRDDHVR